MIPQTQQGKGPVGVKKTPRKRLAAMGRPATKGSFTKKNPRPGPGRPRGVPNKFSGELKEAILAGVNGSHPLGVSGFVLKLSIETPTSAAALLGRLIPVSMVGALGGKIVVVHRDETAADPELLILDAKPEVSSGLSPGPVKGCSTFSHSENYRIRTAYRTMRET